MIFLLLGTEELPFDRAVDRALPLTSDDDLVVQHGFTPPRDDAERISWIRFAAYDRILALCREASAVVCHAGVGTIMTAMSAGKTPLVIPRLARFGEAVDDHQLQISSELARTNMVVHLEDADDIREAIRLTAVSQESRERSVSLHRAVAEAVDGTAEPALRRLFHAWTAGRS